ncbi:MAG: hypothetical protein K9W46_13150 [Candidatus Heimdallarchaeum endolithica]|uniref:HD domain-containing protein n=1 Tax=Candidatus Heimdallarchaeum endolithica TaxID=2876572 RepID=A0A9Y1BQC9_9ARCH|nr:MAG: hypothetical protein K9W46_13150 [Candidatus Heimdallarchaeum endolithica]
MTVNEYVVMEFFLEQMSQNKITFLADRPRQKEIIREKILHLTKCDNLHDKILAAKSLWRVLFESAMSFIDENKRGYDDLFSYFDAFVNFEELIFASDSFYRDHTLHSLWVYFLGEYLFRAQEFQPLWTNFNYPFRVLLKAKKILEHLDCPEVFETYSKTLDAIIPFINFEDSIRCIAALTHDLGYPLKKVEKINKSIRTVLPYFAVFDVEEFNFKFDTTQQFYISKFLELLGYELMITPKSPKIYDDELLQPLKPFINKLNELLTTSLKQEIAEEAIQFMKSELANLSPRHKRLLNQIYRLNGRFETIITRLLRFSDDFEKFKHGIMSSFLLVKLLSTFANIDIRYSDPADIPIMTMNLPSIFAKLEILKAVANHTSSYRIQNFNDFSSLLILIDEIEEFSRISRANQFRQYVNEFCSSSIFFSDNCLTINFIFDNPNIPDLNPELAFKGKANRFLDLFDISEFQEDLSVKFIVTDKMNTPGRNYELIIEKNNFEILIDNEKKEPSAYLKTYEIV